MSSLNTALLDESKRDGSSILPALQKLLQLAYSDDTDKQLEAVMGISGLIERRPVSAPSFGPLCHTLSRLAASDQRAVVAYAARGIKLLVLNDSLRPQATVAGIPSVLTVALREWEDDGPCLREVLGALQTLSCDKATVLAVVNAGAVGPVVELLDTDDLELRILATAISANLLSFSDSLLLANEECIDDFADSMEDLLDAAKSGEGLLRDYGIAAVANACAHPVLAGRAKELGALQQMRKLLESSSHDRPFSRLSLAESSGTRRARLGRHQRAETAVARLSGTGFWGSDGDIEEGRVAGGPRGVTSSQLQFYTFKWGVHPNVRVSFLRSPTDRVWAIAGCVFWCLIVFLVLRPILR